MVFLKGIDEELNKQGDDGKAFTLGRYLCRDRDSIAASHRTLSTEMVKFSESGKNTESRCISPCSSMEDIVRKLLNDDSSSSDDGDSLISSSQRHEEPVLSAGHRYGDNYPLGRPRWAEESAIRCNELRQVPVSLVAKNYGLLTLDTDPPAPYVGPAEPPTLLALATLHGAMDRPPCPPSVSPPDYVVYPPRRDNSVDSGYTQSPVQCDPFHFNISDNAGYDHCLTDAIDFGPAFTDKIGYCQGLSDPINFGHCLSDAIDFGQGLSNQASYCHGHADNTSYGPVFADAMNLGQGLSDSMGFGNGRSEPGISYGHGLPNEEDLMNLVQQMNASGTEIALTIAQQLANGEHNRHQDAATYNMVNGCTAPGIGSLTPAVSSSGAWAGCQVGDQIRLLPAVQTSTRPPSLVAFPKNLTSQQLANYNQQSKLCGANAKSLSTEYPLCLSDMRDSVGSPAATLNVTSLPPPPLAAVYNPLVPPPLAHRPLHEQLGIAPQLAAGAGTRSSLGRSAQAWLHAGLEGCQEQLRLLVQERERIQEELAAACGGAKPDSQNYTMLSVTRRSTVAHGTRVDTMIPGHERERNTVLSLIISMGEFYGVTISDSIPNTLLRWDAAIGDVKLCRRQELEMLNAGQDRSQGNEGVAALARSVHSLKDACRAARTALWSMQTVATVLCPDKCVVPSVLRSVR